jgi:predicted transcriptional regulator
MQVREIMSSSIHIIDQSASIHDAAQQMLELDVGMLPVKADGQIIGTVTDRDITVRGTAHGADPEATPVSAVMSDEIFSCMDEDDLELAVQLMEDHQVRRLIVQDRGGQLVGLLSLADLARHVETSTLSAEALSGISQPSLGSSH